MSSAINVQFEELDRKTSDRLFTKLRNRKDDHLETLMKLRWSAYRVEGPEDWRMERQSMDQLLEQLAERHKIQGRDVLLRQCIVFAIFYQSFWWKNYGQLFGTKAIADTRTIRAIDQKIAAVEKQLARSDVGTRKDLTLRPEESYELEECLRIAKEKIQRVEKFGIKGVLPLPRLDLLLASAPLRGLWRAHERVDKLYYRGGLPSPFACFLFDCFFLFDRTVTLRGVSLLDNASSLQRKFGAENVDREVAHFEREARKGICHMQSF
jgi:hypothetical protein